MAREGRRRRRAPRSVKRRGRKNWPWVAAIAAIVLAGGALVAFSRGEAEATAPTTSDHWHAQLTVDICGQELGPAPEFELQDGSGTLVAGIHSHGDGLIHIHPNSSAEAGSNATVGRFMDYGGWSVSSDSLQLWEGVDVSDGDRCEDLDGQTGEVRWSVNGEEQTGDPADYKPSCDDPCVPEAFDQIVIAFLPADAELPEPPPPATPTDQSGASVPVDPNTVDPNTVDPNAIDPNAIDPNATAPEGATPAPVAPVPETPATPAP